MVQSNTEQAAPVSSQAPAELAAFEANCLAISNIFDQHNNEIVRLRARIRRIEADLDECREYLEGHMDVIDGDDGPRPNRAMRLVTMIDDTLHGRK